MRLRAACILVAVVVGSSASASWAASVPGPTVSFVPGSIDRTGHLDVTVALNAYLAGVPDGNTVVFPSRARYRIEGTLSLENRTNLVIEGQGATFFAATNGLARSVPGCDRRSSVCRYPNRTRSQWSFSHDKNIVVRDVNVVGSDMHPGPLGIYDPALEAQHAFNIVGASRIVLDHVSARNVWGDFVYVGAAYVRPRYVTSTDVLVKNSTFRGSSRQGWSITNGERIVFVNNSVDAARRSLIDIEANASSDRIAYITIRNNRLGSSRFCTLTNYGAPAVEHDFVIAHNHMIDSRAIKICVQASRGARRSNFAITGNVGDVAGQGRNEPMVNIAYVDHVTVKGNVQHFSDSSWPWRGSPQAPVTSKCSSVVVTANSFTPRPRGMPEFAGKRC